MATQELALKLQLRLRLEQESEAVQGPQQNGPDGEDCRVRSEPARGQSPGRSTSGEEQPVKELTANADWELKAQLSRNESIHEGTARRRPTKVFKPYTEFPEFSRQQNKDMESLFRPYDSGKVGYIDLMQLKLMMEKLGAHQTHLGLKNMIEEVDEDLDSKLSFQEFLLVFHKAAAGELGDSGLMILAKLSEINVAMEGVKRAKNFFEAKVHALSVTSRFEAEQMARKQEKQRKHRRALFREYQASFSQ
ncbi:EF-hand domain-containing protein D1-like [Trichosurus vulpecula]|uniref:EF-hand domain-containing protein D1-like n=1 Tax=Trichosurus vulpecula TaxID=9337 RepID=UPI00186AD6D2|nr:EF-hand domain-containing protein D1-like [Trichosurus vulpecula]